MKRIAAVILTALFLSQAGCDSQDTSTHEFTGVWLFSGVSDICSQPLPSVYGGGTLEFSAIRIKVYSKETDEDPIKTESVDCADGTFVIDELRRGSYFVKVEAMAEDPTEEIVIDAGPDGSPEVETQAVQTRAYYVGTETVVVPTQDDTPVEFNMSIGKGSIEVGWEFDRGSCASDWNNVDQVSIELKGGSSRNDRESGMLDCALGDQTYLFDELPWDVYTVTVTGYDPDGAETHRGSFDAPVEIRPGTDISGIDSLIELIPLAD